MKRTKYSLLALLPTLCLTGCIFNIDPLPDDSDPVDEHNKTQLKYTYSDYMANNVYDLDCAPSVGEANLLVVPVWFTNSSKYITTTNKEKVRSDIEKAYFGTNSETGWRSVKTYYEEESHGNLTLNGTCTKWFECGYSSSAFYTNEDKVNTLVKEAVAWYKEEYGVSALTDFDKDSNGHLDGVMLIYGAPDYVTEGNENHSNMWAYCYWLQGNNANKTNPTPNAYFWASYDFIYGSGTYAGGDTSHCTIDAHTYIHEMGHIFGLDDYYDYSGKYNPAGGFSMQDYNVGGHDPYSAMALGWASPYIATKSDTYTIRDFQSSGDLLLLANHDVNSPFDEYILLELYTPTGLNKFDSDYSYVGSYPKGPSTPGIRIWHVDGRLLYTKTGSFSESNVTTNPLTSNGYVYHMMSNTYYSSDTQDYCSPLGKSYANYDLLHLVRNNYTGTYKGTDDLSAKSLFKEGNSFSIDAASIKKQFVNEGLMNDKTELGWEIKIDSLSSSSATITVTKK